MFIPPDVRVGVTLRAGVVYYFVDENFVATHPHFFVALNSNPQEDGKVLLLCAVTLDIKVLQTKEALGRVPNETLFDITPDQCSLFRHPTLFDCNEVIDKPTKYLVDKLSEGRLEIRGDLPPEILIKLQKGVVASKHVERRYKRLITLPDSQSGTL